MDRPFLVITCQGIAPREAAVQCGHLRGHHRRLRQGLSMAPVVAAPGPPAAGAVGAQRHRLQRRHQRMRQGRPMAAGATAVGCDGDWRLGFRKRIYVWDDQFGVCRYAPEPKRLYKYINITYVG